MLASPFVAEVLLVRRKKKEKSVFVSFGEDCSLHAPCI